MLCMPALSPVPLLRYSRRVAHVEAADAQLLDALRAGDESAFAALVREQHASLVRVARIYVSTRSAAEEVAQETWLGVLKGLERFEGRSSLRTWIFSILTNLAKTRARGARDGLPRGCPFGRRTGAFRGVHRRLPRVRDLPRADPADDRIGGATAGRRADARRRTSPARGLSRLALLTESPKKVAGLT